MQRPLALIVDDEPDIRELAQLTLEQMDLEVRTAPDLHTSRALLAAEPFSLCLTDMRLPDGDGLDLVRLMQKHHPDTPVAVITAHGSIETATAALKAGAFDFVTKPVDLHVLRRLVEHALRLSEFPEVDRRSRNILLGDSPAMQHVRSTIVKLARSQAPVYICGESGTGKELIARLIHDKGPRRDRAFVPVNCGAIPAELMESEFFGHKKGSFTGASVDKPGLFQAADRGTLFLDEVAELPPHMQVKLLRAIQEKAVRPVGTLREESTDVRILSATHKDLGQLVADGAFRRDLYYRINVIQVRAPSLRERTEDIPLLVEHILRRMVGEANPLPRLDAAALTALKAYAFPGNVRELENILERALTLSENALISAADLQLPQKSPEAQAPTTVEPAPDFELESYLGEVEREVIVKALEKSRYNKTAAAQLLGITFRALRYRLKKLGLE
ncbi:MAG: sigma-54-dependent Fis family transcriptional regulator [Nitrococcus mobilis]|nr:sigma-54-dependent Fis family transcriptional regulator [Nitrococcus mobilis]